MDWLKTHRNDVLLIAALLVLAGALALFLRLGRRDGGYVSVSVGGEIVAELPLDEDASLPIETEGGRNLLVIEDGAARIESADCPDLLCVKMGSVRWAGESIVCLPHRVVVTVEEGPDGGFDAASR